jgi:ABC-type uncharacterized transport system substrate-binding protein
MSDQVLKQARCFGIALFLLAASSVPALAHPHVWIDMKTDLVFGDAKKLDALTITWTFDEFYSAFAVQDFTKRPDGSYDPADLAKLAQVNLDNLKDWNYFTEVTQKGKPVKLGPANHGVSSYDAKAGTLTLTFTVPLTTPVAATEALPLQFRIYDPSFYIAIDYVKKDPIHLMQGNHEGCAVSTQIPNAEKIWSTLPESAFNGPKAVSLGKNFATTATLVCK